VSSDDCAAVFIIGVIVLLFAGFMVNDTTNNAWERELMEDGYAEYHLDKDNIRQWRMLPKGHWEVVK
tara:strand:+ start:983 stop:1183 length:201 start_codon:yes stop_codon:yes gene_type:complete